MGNDPEAGIPGETGEGGVEGARFVRLTGERVMLQVRPVVDLSSVEKRVISGVDVSERVLQGHVLRVAPAVTVDVAPGDEVIFSRPEGMLPEVAILDQELLLAVVSYSK